MMSGLSSEVKLPYISQSPTLIILYYDSILFVKYIVSILIVILLITGWILYDYSNNAYSKINNKNDKNFTFEVKPNSTVNDIVDDLYEKSVINNPIYLKVYIRLNGINNIRAGQYVFQPGINYDDLLRTFNILQTEQIKVFFAEGLRYDEVIDKIISSYNAGNSNKLDETIFTDLIVNPPAELISKFPIIRSMKPEGKTLEGFLFPDTYLVPINSDEKDVLSIILSNFSKKIESLKSGSNDYTKMDYDNLILGSIIEKESDGKPENSGLISGVFKNRLEGALGHRFLQSDVVLLYQYKDWKKVLTYADLENKKFEYNSYVHEGLPPTPVCSPGMIAIKAAYYPTNTDYLFFIAGNDGKIYYAKTYNEHLVNVQKYL